MDVTAVTAVDIEWGPGSQPRAVVKDQNFRQSLKHELSRYLDGTRTDLLENGGRVDRVLAVLLLSYNMRTTAPGRASLVHLRNFVVIWVAGLVSSPKLLWEIVPVLWYNSRVCVRALDIPNGCMFNSLVSLRTGQLRDWHVDDHGRGTAVIIEGSNSTRYFFATDDLLANPSLLTIPNLKFQTSSASTQAYLNLVLPLPWPAKDVVRQEYFFL